MSNAVIGLFFGCGLGGFIYSKMIRQTGGNTKSSIIIAVLVGVVGFFVIFTLFNTFLSDN